jgi:hypothetical protein
MIDPVRLALALDCARAQPAWLPDVFATIYDLLSAGGLALDLPGAAAPVPASFDRQHFLQLRHRQDIGLGDLTEDLRDVLVEALSGLRSDASKTASHWGDLLNVARLIDRVFFGVTHSSDAFPFYSRYRAELRDMQNLVRASGVGGWVLSRRAAQSLPPREVADLFQYLLRINANEDYSVDYRLVHRARTGLRDGPLRIGFAPLVHLIDQLQWEIADGRYTVQLSPATERELLAALPATLDWLAARDAYFVLMPELVSSPTLVNAIARWRANHPGGLPYVIMAGSHLFDERGADRSIRNRAVVLDSSGTKLWHQDKLHRYLFTVGHQLSGGWNLCKPPRDLEEGIHVAPRKLVIRDINGHRIAVAICEDFARAQPYHKAIVDFGATHNFVPIMNPRRDGEDWLRRYGITLAQEPGTMSMISNSGTLVRRNPTLVEDYSALFHGSRHKVRDIEEMRDPATGSLIAAVREL